MLGTAHSIPKADVLIAPNPASSSIRLSIANTHSVEWSLFNTMGQLLRLGRGDGTQTFDRDGLPPGVYSLLVKTGEGRQGTYKVVFE